MEPLLSPVARRIQWAAIIAIVAVLMWLLAPILTPFVFAAMLGWLGDPTVDRLQRRGWSRQTAVVLVFSTMAFVLLVTLLLLLPLIERQLITLVESLPKYRDWFIGTVLPWVERRTGLDLLGWLDPDRIVQLIREHWERAGGIATTMLGYLSASGFALIAWVANVVLIPVLTFYFLRDWDVLCLLYTSDAADD